MSDDITSFEFEGIGGTLEIVPGHPKAEWKATYGGYSHTDRNMYVAIDAVMAQIAKARKEHEAQMLKEIEHE